MTQTAGEYRGFAMFFEGISYPCPALKLWGYSTDSALKRAIDKELLKRERRNTARREREQVMRDCGLTRGKDSLGRTIWE
jgi:hypothetical protein